MTRDTVFWFILTSGLVLLLVAGCLTLAVWSALALFDVVSSRCAAATELPAMITTEDAPPAPRGGGKPSPDKRDAAPVLLHQERGTMAGKTDPTSGGAA